MRVFPSCFEGMVSRIDLLLHICPIYDEFWRGTHPSREKSLTLSGKPLLAMVDAILESQPGFLSPWLSRDACSISGMVLIEVMA